MCLGIPGELVGLPAPGADLAPVRVAGVTRPVNVALLREPEQPPLAVGDWVLVHLGFALTRIDRAEAEASLAFVTGTSAAFADRFAQPGR